MLYLLYQASEAKGWPATDALVFAPLLVVAVLVPTMVVAGLGTLRPRVLAIWTAVAIAACAGLAIYDIFREPFVAGTVVVPRIAPTNSVWLSLASILFVTHSLIVSAEADRKLVASYSRLFDVSWKHGVQLVLAASFVGAFWGLLWLGAELFRLINIQSLANLIRRPWFAAPATTLVLVYAMHVTDGRGDLVRGARTLALTLLAWLLPMMTAFAVAFVLALLFTGLQPLWNTQRATAILLAAVAALIFLINAAYQDGQAGDTAAGALRYARCIAAAVLVPLVALAAYGLMLRAQQYGWTPQRIVALACVGVAACYAVGYTLATLRVGFALKGLEPTNVLTAYVIVAVVFLLFSPIADPARISVADQIGRLQSGLVSPDEFDFKFLQFRSGRYGRAALESLAVRTEGPHAAAIAEKAKETLRMRISVEQVQTTIVPATPQSRATNIVVVHPRGQELPDSFLRYDWTARQKQWPLPRCLVANAKCNAVLSDLDGDGSMEVLLFALPVGDLRGLTVEAAGAYKSGPDETWSWLGPIVNVHCPGVRAALMAGQFRTVEPLLKEIDVNGQRLRVNTDRCAQPSVGGPIRPAQ